MDFNETGVVGYLHQSGPGNGKHTIRKDVLFRTSGIEGDTHAGTVAPAGESSFL